MVEPTARFAMSLSFIIFLSTLSFIGLTAMFFALAAWTRESGCSPSWLRTRSGLPVAFLLVGGAGLIASNQYKLPRSLMVDTQVMETLSGRWAVFSMLCLVLMVVGVVLRVSRRPTGTRAAGFTRVLAWSAAAA